MKFFAMVRPSDSSNTLNTLSKDIYTLVEQFKHDDFINSQNIKTALSKTPKTKHAKIDDGKVLIGMQHMFIEQIRQIYFARINSSSLSKASMLIAFFASIKILCNFSRSSNGS